MPFCSNCGTKTDGKFCPNCGAPISASATSAPRPGAEQPKEQSRTGAQPTSGYGYTPTGEQSRTGAQPTGGYGYTPTGEQSRTGAQPTGGYGSNPTGGQSRTGSQPTSGYGFVPKGEQPRAGGAANYGAGGPDPANYQLGWHKFMIYFLLWASALLNIVTGVSSLQAVQEVAAYGIPGTGTFCTLGGLSGLLCIVLGVFQIYVRFQLAKFKQGAPKKLALSYGIAAAASLLAIIAIISVSTSLLEPSAISSLAWSLVWLFVSWRYYSSREELFVN